MPPLHTGIRLARPHSGTLLTALVAGVAALGAALPGQGQEADATVDFGPAFERLYALGLPDVTDAKPVETSDYDSDSPPAWIVLESETEATLLLDQMSPTRCRKGASGDEEDADDDVRTGLTWRPAKIEVFLKRVTKKLEAQKAEMLKSDYYYNDIGEYYGTYLLFAAHLHRRGQRDEANTLATLLFESSKVPETAVTLGLEALAGARYEGVARTFFRDGDWLAFAKGIDGLVADFGSRWAMAPGARLLAEKLRARATAPAPPAINVPGLDAVDQSILASLASLEPGAELPSGTLRDGDGEARLWILDLPVPAEGDASVFPRILARGTESLPLLLALVGDEYLLPVATSGLNDYESRSLRAQMLSQFSDDFSDDDPTTPEMLYAQLTRPISRGEIALSLLSPLLAPEAEDVTDPAQLAPLVRNWVAAHGKKSPLELARFYLKSGRDAQVRAAVGVLIDQGEEADLAEIEKYLLVYDPERGYVFEKFGAVATYLKKRGAEGKDFLARYEDMTRKAYHEEQGNGFLQKMSTNSELKRYFAPLHELVNPRTFDDMLKETLEGDAPVSEMSPLIASKIQELEDDKEKKAALGSLLRAVTSQSERPEKAFGLLGIIGSSFREYEGPPLALSHEEEWRAVLEIESAKPSAFGARSLTTAEYAAYLLEFIYGGAEEAQRFGSLYLLDWRRANALGMARARARLDGKTGADLPEVPLLGDGADSAQEAALWKRLAAAEPATLRENSAGLSWEELTAIQNRLVAYRQARDREKLDEMEDAPDPELLASLARNANRIVSVSLPDELADAVPVLRDAKDTVLDKARLEALVEALKPLASADSPHLLTVTIRRGDLLSGTTVTVSRGPASTLPPEERRALTQRQHSFGKDAPHALVAGYYDFINSRDMALWDCGAAPASPAAEKPGETRAEGADNADDDALVVGDDSGNDPSSAASQIEGFWKTIDHLFDGTENPFAYAAIVFWAVPAPAFAPESEPTAEENSAASPSP